MTEYGNGGSFSVTMDGPFGGGGSGETEKLTVIQALASNWKGGTSPYYQAIRVDGISVNSKIHIHMDAEQLNLLRDQRITFTVANKNGAATLYAIGDKPASDCVFQVTVGDVMNISGESIEEIQGNTISTQTPQTDYNQNEPGKSDYIKNKPELLNMDLFSLTLYAANWAGNMQTVEASKVLADSDKQAIISVADSGSRETYLDCNIDMESQGDGTLTFSCDDVPDSDVVLNIMILTKGV